MASKWKVLFVFSSLLIHFSYAVPERGVKEMVFDKAGQFKSFAKSLFKDAKITITGQIFNTTKEKLPKKHDLSLNWYLLESDCAQYFFQVKDELLPALTAQVPTDQQMHKIYNKGVMAFKGGHLHKETIITLERQAEKEDEIQDKRENDTPSNEQEKPQEGKPHKPQTNKERQTEKEDEIQDKRENETPSNEQEKPQEGKPHKPQTNKRKPAAQPPPSQHNNRHTKQKRNAAEETKPATKLDGKSKTKSNVLSKTKRKKAGIDGNYLLVISLPGELPKHTSVQVKVKIKMSTGYLSAAEWPLLPFYGAMSLVYLAYGVVWLIVSACQWRELLRIQFWIGGVIALGMLEKAILFSEYNNVNETGIPAHGLVVLALVLSCIKRTLSRILIIIVSMGFGIVKPRLGGALHRVLGVGCLYFILCVIEGSYREFSVKADVNRKQMIASVPLSVLDAVICWWIFMSLLQTMRTLRIRKNLVKLSLYRHFTNILVVSVIASVAFMVWVIKSHSFNNCIKDWKEIWIDDAFWHFLFALILLAIMVLWRPTANNQRYAFTPLIDVGEDDDDDMTLSDAFHGMKMRNKGDAEAPYDRAEKQRKKAEDDLKWVEENIPTSGGIDTALPSLLDSDEEMMTTKLEMSKME